MPIEVDTSVLLTRKETAKLLKRHPDTISRYMRRGLLSPVRFGEKGHALFRAEEVEGLVKGERR